MDLMIWDFRVLNMGRSGEESSFTKRLETHDSERGAMPYIIYISGSVFVSAPTRLDEIYLTCRSVHPLRDFEVILVWGRWLACR